MKPPHDPVRNAHEFLASAPSARWHQLSETTVVFGHQSIGHNILDGIELISARYPSLELHVVELSVAQAARGDVPDGPGLFHFPAGRNRQPHAKIGDFREVMASELGRRAELALLKLCYGDLGYEIEAEPVFEAYVKAVDQLRLTNPDTRLIHATCPLKVPERKTAVDRAKNLTKRALGRPVYGDPNRERNRYNQRIIARYSPVVFDIARVESTRADGSRAVCSLDGEEIFFMLEEFTEDGGHLSPLGKERVAEEFLRALLASLD